MKTLCTKIDQLSAPQLLLGEWLITNGLGGYACGSLCGAPLRKYHSLLIAALPNPYGRTILLNYVADAIILPDGSEVPLSFLRHGSEKHVAAATPSEFRLENGLPVWIYDIDGVIVEKSLLLIHRQNTLHMSYMVKSQHQGISLRWRPYFHFRANEEPVNKTIPEESYTVHARDSQYEITCPGFPPLKLFNGSQTPFSIDTHVEKDVFYELEEQRGYACYGTLTSPGYYTAALFPRERVTFVASTENWNTIFALTPKEAWITENMRKRRLLKTAGACGKHPDTRELVLASDQFLITPTTRYEDMVRLQAAGEEIRSIIAGFPWFTDWGRDTMICLEGLTLTTGRYREAHAILRTFAHYVMEGLIPNMFPDGENKGIYNTADATLWFFHALDRYIQVTGDEEILELLLPKLENIIQHHVKGTLFGIKMDEDGLLVQGHQGVQLTWMDAKVGDWVVTPRRGKAVEINGLWYNALRLYEKWANKSPELSAQCYVSFNKKFWYEEGQYLYDVIEGENGHDSALRPNQLLAISLAHPVLSQDYWKPVFEAVQNDLYTPVGLRTLSPQHPDYKATYDGDLWARDAAYHQGSVWPWLLGPYIDVWLKIYPGDYEGAYAKLTGLQSHLNSYCMGTIGEIFDATPPYNARGCFAQAWSVAEILRCLAMLSPHVKGVS